MLCSPGWSLAQNPPVSASQVFRQESSLEHDPSRAKWKHLLGGRQYTHVFNVVEQRNVCSLFLCPCKIEDEAPGPCQWYIMGNCYPRRWFGWVLETTEGRTSDSEAALQFFLLHTAGDITAWPSKRRNREMQHTLCSLTTGFGNKDIDYEILFLSNRFFRLEGRFSGIPANFLFLWKLTKTRSNLERKGLILLTHPNDESPSLSETKADT